MLLLVSRDFLIYNSLGSRGRCLLRRADGVKRVSISIKFKAVINSWIENVCLFGRPNDAVRDGLKVFQQRPGIVILPDLIDEPLKGQTHKIAGRESRNRQ